jgi:RNA polymerase sigma factor (sigma-70 family)
MVLNAALRVLGDADAASDVHQDAFLAVWRRWQKYDGQVNWAAYLRRSAVRKALEYARRARRNPSSHDASQAVSPGATPEAEARAAELRERLLACLTRMPARQADAFVLSRIEGLSHAQVADALGCSIATARVHLHRALKRLSRELSDCLS